MFGEIYFHDKEIYFSLLTINNMIRLNRSSLKKLKKEFNLTNENIAEILGVSKRHITNYENTNQDYILKMPVNHIVTLTNRFNLPIDYFFESDIPLVLSGETGSPDEYKHKLINALEDHLNYRNKTEKIIEELRAENEKLKANAK